MREHGPREMPVWGARYRLSEDPEDKPSEEALFGAFWKKYGK
mgnify:CR=1 FL=1